MSKSVEYYLDNGFDQVTAQYFSEGRKRIINVVPSEDYTLILTFDNKEIRRYDVKPMIKPNTMFEFLHIPENFNRVYLDDTHCVSWDIDPLIDSNIVWSNKVDLSSDTCYLESVLI